MKELEFSDAFFWMVNLNGVGFIHSTVNEIPLLDLKSYHLVLIL